MASREFHRIDANDMKIVRQHLSVKPVQLGAMARELGLSVKLSALGAGQSGSIEPHDDGYLIKINRYETRERQRFTLAHEIAHFLLHRDIINKTGGIVDNVLYRSGQPEQVEYEANRLAADLVMPAHLIDEEISNRPVTEEMIDRLARRFQVSKAAMEIRLGPVAA